MKKVFFASVFALALAACGGGNKEAQLAKMCMDEGDYTSSECDCMAKTAVAKMDDKMVDILLKASKSGEDSNADMTELMKDLSAAEMGQFIAAGMEIETTCGVS